jgi:hypothetical protein
MEATALISRIERAFPPDPLPTMSLRQAVLADQTLTKEIADGEWEAERRRDGKIIWTDISDEMLTECEVGLAHLDGESFVYYLGAFLRYGANHIAADLLTPEGKALGTVVSSVTHRSNYNLSRLKQLSDAQIDCVIEFLRFVEKRSETHATDASKALARYWLKPEARQRTIIHVP